MARPLKFKTVEEMQKLIDVYFAERKADKLPFTITGLALALDTTRQTLLEYEGEVDGRDDKDPRFADAIKRAKLRCEEYAETQAFMGKNQAGSIFILKNHGWKDKTEVESTNKVILLDE